MERNELLVLLAQPAYRALAKRVIDQRRRMLVELPQGAGIPSTGTGAHLCIRPGHALQRSI